jgi:predicted permease
MDNLMFSLNATVPVFLMMVLGLVFRKLGWLDETFADKMNKFVFMVPLPVLVFEDLATVDFAEVWDTRFVFFCFAVTLVSIGIAAGISCLWKDKSLQGEFIQVSYRSSAALLGVALIQNIYGDAGMAPLMMIGSVPLYNVMAVVVLSFFHPERKGIDREVMKRTVKGIVTNPIIIAIVLGLLWSAFRIPMPSIMQKTVSGIGGMATPMGLMAMGAAFDVRRAFAKVKPAVAAVFIKLVGFCALFLPAAVALGFRESELVAILVMLGSATTVSCFVMAKNMGHEGVLTSSVVMLTTLFSGFTLTGWIYLLRSFALI